MIDSVDRLTKKQDAVLRTVKLMLLDDLQRSTQKFTSLVDEANEVNRHLKSVKDNLSIVDELLEL